VGISVFVIDVTKGMLSVVIVQAAAASEVVVLATGMATVVGHNWPMFIGFRGGRGEATTIGVLLPLVTQPMLIVAGAGLAALLVHKNVMVASCVLFIPLPLVCWWLDVPGTLVAYSVAPPCLVGITHYLRTRQASGASATGAA